ncbi:MAG: TatD family hydrolase [Bacteroidales bacterium]|jgi:TatD DNase family protein|nr:TatD family hydrolase [Bacteroidales bacterium]
MYFIDTHTHCCTEYYPKELDRVINDAIKANVIKMIVPCVNASSVPDIADATTRYSANLFGMIGLHPSDVNEHYQEELAELKKHLHDTHIIGVGEIGMDLYHDRTFLEEQRDAFLMQLHWAKAYNLPLSIHIRDAYEEAFAVLKHFENQGLTGVLHCFSGGIQEAKWAVNFGFYLGIGGVVTFKNSKLKEIVKTIGLSHIVLETDAPFLAPVPFRGQPNESAYIPLIANYLSDLFNVSTEEIARITTENAERIFKI